MQESVIDPTRIELDRSVFNVVDGRYVLKPAIRLQILWIVRRLQIPIRGVFIKGSILSLQWLPTTDVDILIETDETMPDSEYDDLKELLKTRYTDILVRGTRHPYQFYAVRGRYDRSRADGMYDVIGDEWLFGPYNLEVNVDDYWNAFQKTVHDVDLAKNELQRDIIDYDMLRSLKGEQIHDLELRTQKKIDEINDSVETLVAQYEWLSDLRDWAFTKDLSSEEIREYGSKNALPGNVIYKLLERYHYIELMKNLKRLKKEQGEIDTDDDVEKVKEIL